MSRVLLVGEHNPYGADPRFALYPDPPNSAGGRLCHKILRMTERQYLRTFDRANLLDTEGWSAPRAREAANRVLNEGDWGRIVCCGARVARAFGLPATPFRLHEIPHQGVDLLVLPHPSGRSRAWNDRGAADLARGMVNNMLAVSG